MYESAKQLNMDESLSQLIHTTQRTLDGIPTLSLLIVEGHNEYTNFGKGPNFKTYLLFG